ncbi:MAG: PAS domain S-box protein [Promethearchaeota archaeon]
MQANTNILVVDEDKTFLNHLKAYLEEKSENLIITTIFSSYDVLEQLENHNYDVIVAIHEMSGLTGLEILAKLRKRGDFTPFIVFTGKSREEVVIEALNLGADYYLQKGSDLKSLFTELFIIIQKEVEKKREQEKHKQIEKALEESQEKYSKLFQYSNDAIFIHDLEANIIDVNQKTLDLFGYTKSEILSLKIMDLHPSKMLEASENAFSRISKERFVNFEIEFKKKNGEVFLADVSSSLFEISGKNVIQGIVRDITERKKIEKELLEKEERYRTFVQNFQGIAFRSKIDFTPIFFHGQVESITGYKEKELTAGTPSWNQIIHPEDLPQTSESIKQIASHPNFSTEREYRIICKDGQIKWIHELIKNFCDDSGKPIGIQGTIYDITESKRMEDQIRRTSSIVEELNESLKIINDILRHDILNDLAVIRGYLDLFKDVRDIELLERAYKPITKIAELINRMRELEHLIARDKALQAYDIRQIVEGVLKDYATSTVEFNVEGEGTGLADLALNSVIDNLIRNALTHTDTEQIDIKIKEQGSVCEIRVTDYGSGIPDEIKTKIFEPGFKHGKKGHMGLGLYIVKKIIERYGGKMTVEDNFFILKDKKGKGTTFVLNLKRP